MNFDFKNSVIAGLERVSAWADLLDMINVYPVADGDTGRNLKISLSPLRQLENDTAGTVHSMLLSARGNSGNIAARFFSGFLQADSMETLPAAVKSGRDNAWKAVSEPVEGTMLSIYDALADISGDGVFGSNENWVDDIMDHLEDAVHSTMETLPRLKEAKVVDAGALGMFIFFDGFFNFLAGNTGRYRSVTEIFKNKLKIARSFREQSEAGYCIDTVMQVEDVNTEAVKNLNDLDENVVVIQDHDCFKIHFHTDNKVAARERLESYGKIVNWEDDDLELQVREFAASDTEQSIHIMTDAAGSVTRDDAKEYGLTLLDSYVLFGNRCVPETHLLPEQLFNTMEGGIKVSTSQASDFERQENYKSILSLYPEVIYICVGSVYTGNYNIALKWKEDNDPDNRFTVIDSGAASGKLGLVVTAAARYIKENSNINDAVDFIERAINQCHEYIFLEKLQYLAAGGRMSKTGAFFGNMFNVKPVVTPMPDGASKAGVVRNTKDQLKFLFDKMSNHLNADSNAMIMIEYTDNRKWVEDVVRNEMKTTYSSSEIIIQPLSLTTGVHTGPGTWGVAFLDVEKIG